MIAQVRKEVLHHAEQERAETASSRLRGVKHMPAEQPGEEFLGQLARSVVVTAPAA
jgi:hypothetical protein